MTNTAKAWFAAGCFWGVEAQFRQVLGVTETAVGYAGGAVPEPTYRDVCSGRTGHAETVEVTFDPNRVSYKDLLDVFWRVHDPTQGNRQGPDIGSQYRSIIFYLDDVQRATAEASLAELAASGVHAHPISTEIIPAERFWMGEDYHQQYFEKRGLGARGLA